MRVLITNIWLVDWGGTEVYVRDLAIALDKRGIGVEVYSPELGSVAEEIRRAGIHVADSIADIQHVPDIIHAHHTVPALDMLSRFPDTPAIYVLHARNYPEDTPPKHNRILRYIAVDHNTLEQLLTKEEIPQRHTDVFLNWVDTERFVLRDHWRDKPARALVFSNYATRDNHFRFIQEACEIAGLQLDCRGRGIGDPIGDPETILGGYDIVFAKAKAAIEALATGAMVIPCDFKGLGEAVGTRNFAHIRKYNFGMKILNKPIETPLLIEQIKKYSPAEIKKVAVRIRQEASLSSYVDSMVSLYGRTIRQYNAGYRIYDGDGQLLPLMGGAGRLSRWWRGITHPY
jgi:hypothetical protein